jgi:hypothetical protein
MRRGAIAPAIVVLALVAVACPKSATTSTGAPPSSAGSPSSSVDVGAIPRVEPGGAPTAAAAMKKLCIAPTIEKSPPVKVTPPPPAIAQVEAEVQQVRGLDYLHPVAVQEVSNQEMDRKLAAAFDDTYPVNYYARRTIAWRTIGVIPLGADLRTALHTFETGQVVGFYDPDSKRLVFLGSGQGDLSVDERLTLAHELTHALDDQHFDLRRLDAIAAACRDEDFEAALGAIEGNAQYTAAEVLVRSPGGFDLGDVIASLLNLGSREVPGVPPFLTAIELWPYSAGLAFVQSVATQGGEQAVDHLLRDLPTSTEQVIHPALYPSDTPVPVDVPNLTRALGAGWGDLDAMQVGEEWLTAMLSLRLDDATAASAASGWDGGVYRAFTNGKQVGVVLATAWDSEADAAEFAGAAGDWVSRGSTPARVHQDGVRVTIAFATDSATLDRLSAALRSA